MTGITYPGIVFPLLHYPPVSQIELIRMCFPQMTNTHLKFTVFKDDNKYITH